MRREHGRTGEEQEYVSFFVVTSKGEVECFTMRVGPQWVVGFNLPSGASRAPIFRKTREEGEEVAKAMAYVLEEFDGITDTLADQLDQPTGPLRIPEELRRPLDACRNLFGPLTDEYAGKIVALYQHPCEETWEEAYCIVLAPGLMETLWNFVLAADPTFPRVGGSHDGYGEKTSGWPRIPDRALILAALEKAAAANAA